MLFNIFTGMKPGFAREGWNLKWPLLERAYIFETRTRDRNFPTVTFNRDMQTVNVTLRLLYKPRLEKLSNIYETLGLDYDDRVLPSIVNEVLKTVIAQYDAVQLLTQREQVSSNIRRTLEQRASHYNILLDDVSITHLNFSKEFEKAIEDKQVAQQEAERAKNLVLKAEQEKKSYIQKAEGEAKAAELIGHAVKQNPCKYYFQPSHNFPLLNSLCPNSENSNCSRNRSDCLRVQEPSAS